MTEIIPNKKFLKTALFTVIFILLEDIAKTVEPTVELYDMKQYCDTSLHTDFC